jgi:serine/threonine-protein kinase RsbT
MASQLPFTPGDLAVMATAVSELARNILNYAGEGEIVVAVAPDGRRTGIVVVARDAGPGIADPELAMQDGYSTSQGLGLGLPGTRRLMDEFALVTAPGAGTTVTAKKWAP